MGRQQWSSKRLGCYSSFCSRRDGPSVHIPNTAWDATPRIGANGVGGVIGWGAARNRGCDAPTPHAARGDSPEGDAPITLDAHEWEEEQIRLDRDWYMGVEEGGVVEDEEHNPLSTYSDLGQLKTAELATHAQ